MGMRLAWSQRNDWGELARVAQYDVNEICRLGNVSRRQLQREFRRSFQCSPRDWLNRIRIQEAQRLLLSGESVKKVALDLNFKQVSHFCRQFKLQMSVTPSEFVLLQMGCRAGIMNVAPG